MHTVASRAWPLREEVYYYTRKFRGGFVLIDDFRVPLAAKPGHAKPAVVEEFGFDAYDGQECSFEYIAGQMPPQTEVPWQLYYPVSAQPVIGNTEFNRSLNDVYTSRTNAEPEVSSCTEAGRCTGTSMQRPAWEACFGAKTASCSPDPPIQHVF